MDIVSWWSELDISAKAEVVMLAVVYGTFFVSIGIMSLDSLKEAFKKKFKAVTEPKPRAARVPRPRNRMLDAFFGFWNWYFRLLGI
jgi:hypothetical protein